MLVIETVNVFGCIHYVLPKILCTNFAFNVGLQVFNKKILYWLDLCLYLIFILVSKVCTVTVSQRCCHLLLIPSEFSVNSENWRSLTPPWLRTIIQRVSKRDLFMAAFVYGIKSWNSLCRSLLPGWTCYCSLQLLLLPPCNTNTQLKYELYM